MYANPLENGIMFLFQLITPPIKPSVKLNDVEIVKFPLRGPEWDDLVVNSKFKDWKDFAKFKTGKIGLQDHGDGVSYRNIKIREL